MSRTIFIIISGIGTLFSFYMSYLSFNAGENGYFLFASFGLLLGIPFVILAFNPAPKKISPVSFTPHWIIMTQIILVSIAILAAILVPMFSK